MGGAAENPPRLSTAFGKTESPRGTEVTTKSGDGQHPSDLNATALLSRTEAVGAHQLGPAHRHALETTRHFLMDPPFLSRGCSAERKCLCPENRNACTALSGRRPARSRGARSLPDIPARRPARPLGLGGLGGPRAHLLRSLSTCFRHFPPKSIGTMITAGPPRPHPDSDTGERQDTQL